jgi:hypothetical protein
MGDQSTKQARKRRRPLGYSKPWLGTIAIGVVAVLVGAMLLVKAAGVGYRHYTAQFLQAARAAGGKPDHDRRDPRRRGDQHEAGRRSGRGRTERSRRRRIRQGLKAIIKVTTILGSRYLALQPARGRCAARRHVRPLPHRGPYDLQEALADVTNTYEQVDTDRFAESLAVLGKQLQSLPPVVPAAVQNIHRLSSIIADRRDQLGSLLKTTKPSATRSNASTPTSPA